MGKGLDGAAPDQHGRRPIASQRPKTGTGETGINAQDDHYPPFLSLSSLIS
jgi:hypothetical protein